MPNVVFRIAVQAVLGLIMPQPALAWLPQHLRRFQKGDPHPHVAPASPDPPKVVLSFLLAFAPRLLGLVVFLFSHSNYGWTTVVCCYMLGVGLAVVSWSIKSAVFFTLSLTYVWGGWFFVLPPLPWSQTPNLCPAWVWGGGEVWLFDPSSMLLVLSSL